LKKVFAKADLSNNSSKDDGAGHYRDLGGGSAASSNTSGSFTSSTTGSGIDNSPGYHGSSSDYHYESSYVDFRDDKVAVLNSIKYKALSDHYRSSCPAEFSKTPEPKKSSSYDYSGSSYSSGPSTGSYSQSKF
jgi:hypothetical protein